MANPRTQGHKTERDLIAKLASTFSFLIPFNLRNTDEANVASARAFSRSADAKGIDVWFSPDLPEWFRSMALQSKKTKVSGKQSKSIDVQPLLRIKNPWRFLYTKLTEKRKVNEVTVAEVVTMDLNTFLVLFEGYHNYKLMEENGLLQDSENQSESTGISK